MYKDIVSNIIERYKDCCMHYNDDYDDYYRFALDVIERIALFDFDDKNLYRELGKIYREIVGEKDD